MWFSCVQVSNKNYAVGCVRNTYSLCMPHTHTHTHTHIHTHTHTPCEFEWTREHWTGTALTHHSVVLLQENSLSCAQAWIVSIPFLVLPGWGSLTTKIFITWNRVGALVPSLEMAWVHERLSVCSRDIWGTVTLAVHSFCTTRNTHHFIDHTRHFGHSVLSEIGKKMPYKWLHIAASQCLGNIILLQTHNYRHFSTLFGEYTEICTIYALLV